MNRRRLLFGAGALLAAPAIVRISSLMPVKIPSALDGLTYGYGGEDPATTVDSTMGRFVGARRAALDARAGRLALAPHPPPTAAHLSAPPVA